MQKEPQGFASDFGVPQLVHNILEFDEFKPCMQSGRVKITRVSGEENQFFLYTPTLI